VNAVKQAQQDDMTVTNKRITEFMNSVNQKLSEQMNSITGALENTQRFLDQVDGRCLFHYSYCFITHSLESYNPRFQM
jgi:hypothetical protein